MLSGSPPKNTTPPSTTTPQPAPQPTVLPNSAPAHLASLQSHFETTEQGFVRGDPCHPGGLVYGGIVGSGAPATPTFLSNLAAPPPAPTLSALSSSPADLSSGGSSYRIPASASSYPIVGIPPSSLYATTQVPIMPPNMYATTNNAGLNATPYGGPPTTLNTTSFPPPPRYSSMMMAGSSNPSSTSGTPLGTSPSSLSLLHQQLQQSQQNVHLLGVGANAAAGAGTSGNLARTPWTLGSTDGQFAYQLALMEQQEQEQQAQQQAQIPQQQPHAIPEETAGHHELLENGPDHTSATGTGTGSIGGVAIGDQSSTGSPVQLPRNQSNNRMHQPGSSAGASVSSASTPPYIVPSQQQHLRISGQAAHSQTLEERLALLSAQQSLYQDRLFQQSSASVESVLAASCEVMGFDIAEMWLRTGTKTHQLTNSHLRPTALEDSVRKDLVDVYYGEKSSERTHRLSPALCKRAKEAGDVVWVTAHTPQGAEALRCSISNVRTAVAIPVCHQASNTNITIIFFSIRRIIVRPTSVEFLVHMALAAGVASVNSLAEEGLLDRATHGNRTSNNHSTSLLTGPHFHAPGALLSQSEHVIGESGVPTTANSTPLSLSLNIRHQRVDKVSVTGAQLDLQWRQLRNVEYLTDGGNSWIHTAVFNGRPVVVKTLKPECQDVALAINEIEGELAVHSRLHHPNIVELLGAGTTSKGVRFVVLERLDGGTLTQRLGYDTRIRDRRRRFWRKKHFSYLDVLRIARSIAQAMTYCHEEAIPGCVALHRDLKPDNIGFTLDGTVKILDFGLAKIVENATVNSDEVYQMSGETGSLRYMAPEVADALPYNHCADVYSFGIILWELNAGKKPFDGLNRELFYERVVHGGERPPLNRKWPKELSSLMSECWDAEMHNRPKFRDVVVRLDGMLKQEKGGTDAKKKQLLPKLSGMIDRHSTWF